MGLWDALSGRTNREHQIRDLVTTLPLQHLKEAVRVQGFIEHYATALAFAVGGTVISFLNDSHETQIREYAEIGKDFRKHEGGIARLAAFCAYWLHDRFLGDNPDIFNNEQGELDETGKSMRADMDEVVQIMYEIDNPTVAAAINLDREMDGDPGLVPGIRAEQSCKIFDLLLGVSRQYPAEVTPENVGSFRDLWERYIKVSSHLIAHRSLVAQNLEIFMDDTKGAEDG